MPGGVEQLGKQALVLVGIGLVLSLLSLWTNRQKVEYCLVARGLGRGVEVGGVWRVGNLCEKLGDGMQATREMGSARVKSTRSRWGGGWSSRRRARARAGVGDKYAGRGAYYKGGICRRAPMLFMPAKACLCLLPEMQPIMRVCGICSRN